MCVRCCARPKCGPEPLHWPEATKSVLTKSWLDKDINLFWTFVSIARLLVDTSDVTQVMRINKGMVALYYVSLSYFFTLRQAVNVRVTDSKNAWAWDHFLGRIRNCRWTNEIFVDSGVSLYLPPAERRQDALSHAGHSKRRLSWTRKGLAMQVKGRFLCRMWSNNVYYNVTYSQNVIRSVILWLTTLKWSNTVGYPVI